MNTIIILTILLVAVLLLMLIRNVLVFRFRMSLMDRIHAANYRDIHNGTTTDLLWRYRYFSTVSYDAMVLHFWVPLKVSNWYASEDFLN